MLSEGEQRTGLARILGSQIAPSVQDEEFLFKPHVDLLERGFQALARAYRDGNFDIYDREEAEFIRQFSAFWRYRFLRFGETSSTEELGFAGRYYVRVGSHLEEMGITQHPMMEGDSTVKLHIFRAEPGGNAWDVIDFEGFPLSSVPGEFYSKVNLATTIDGQSYPYANGYNLELVGNRVNTFQRATVRYHPDQTGQILGKTYVENVGQTFGK